jgi:hypothetical protein
MPDPQLQQIYREARYVVQDGDVKLTIRLDDENAAVNAFLRERGIASWAFLTAYNPWSTLLTEPENQARQDNLVAQLKEAGYTFLEGYGTGDDWDPEPSLFVLDISRSRAVSIAAEYEQHAILWGQTDGAAELVWC